MYLLIYMYVNVYHLISLLLVSKCTTSFPPTNTICKYIPLVLSHMAHPTIHTGICIYVMMLVEIGL